MAGNLVQGALFTVMVVRAETLGDPAFQAEMSRQVERSPRFFLNAPVILDLKNAEGFAEGDDYAAAKTLLRRHTLTLVGVQNAAPRQVEAAAAAGFASFAPNATNPSRRQQREPEAPAAAPPPAAAPTPAVAAPPPPTASPRTRIVAQPVRSGTQIYARGGDLIVTASVSPGAEIVADGNIHVYGALRGRAIAGAGGDSEARIFCNKLEAELVSIAGRYLVSEQLPPDERGQSVHISLINDKLTINRN